MFEFSCLNLCGKYKEVNDDRVVINSRIVLNNSYSAKCDSLCLVAVCDGVGGEKAGYKAAQIVAQALAVLFDNEPNIETLSTTLAVADSLIADISSKIYEYSEMSTTASGILMSEQNAILFNIGDSRVYRYRDPFISLLTTDDTVYEENLAAGLPVTESQKHILTRYLGGDSFRPTVSDISERFFNNDIYIVCSDGIYDYIDEIEMENILSSNQELEVVCRKIAEEAQKNGSLDDMSIICVRRTDNE